MTTDNLHSILSGIAETAVSSKEINLWDKISQHLAASEFHLGKKRKTLMKSVFTQKPALRWVALTLLAFALALGILLATPQGRAWAQDVLNLFTRAESDMIPAYVQPETWVEFTPGGPTLTPAPTSTIDFFANYFTECGIDPTMACTVEQMRSKVDFTVKEPAKIPDGMYFTGANGDPDSVHIRYEYDDNLGSLSVSEDRWTGGPCKTWSTIGQSTVVEDVRIGALRGEYFQGSFEQRGGEDVSVWNPDAGVETLRYVDDNVCYTLVNIYTEQSPMGKNGLVAIAESMTTEPVAKTPMPATPSPTATATGTASQWDVELERVEELAGYKLMLPSRMLANLTSHGGAEYNPASGVASIWYIPDVNYMNGVYLDQQIVSNLDDCAICGVVVGDSTAWELFDSPLIVSTEANLQSVQIGDVTGQYFEGVMKGNGEWDPIPNIKHLRWQANGRAFELISLAAGLNMDSLISIAKSIK